MLWSATEICVYAVVDEQLGQRGEDRLDLRLAVRAALSQLFRDFLIAFSIDVSKGQVFELPFDLPDAQPVGKGRENIERLLGDSLSL